MILLPSLKNKGFTLLEVLITLFIFSIISGIIMASVYFYISTSNSLKKQGQALFDTQRAMLVMSRDFGQFANLTYQKDGRNPEANLIINNNQADFADFTQLGRTNAAAMEARSTLQEVSYIYKNQKIIRRTWFLKSNAKPTYIDEALLTNVSKFSIAILVNGVFVSKYKHFPDEPIPKAVVIQFQRAHLGKVRRVIKLTS